MTRDEIYELLDVLQTHLKIKVSTEETDGLIFRKEHRLKIEITFANETVTSDYVTLPLTDKEN